jgi:hypothetical protein
VAYWLEFGLSFIDNGESAIRWRFPIAFQSYSESAGSSQKALAG